MKTGIGLALGAGGARGIAHVNVLRAFDDLQVKPDIIAGSSIGALVGAGYAAGLSGDDLAEYFISTFSNRSKVFARLWQMRPSSFRDLFATGLPRFGQLDVEKLLSAFIPEVLPKDFSGLELPLLVTATDFYGNSLKVLETGPLQIALAASAAIPVLFKPVIIDGIVYIDGGINNPVPFDVVSGRCGFTIAADVIGLPRGIEGLLPNRLDAGFGASQLRMHSITRHKLLRHPPDVFLRPAIDGFRVLDFLKASEILEATAAMRKETRTVLENFLKNGKPGTHSTATQFP
jgi:NTE family protein